VKPTGNMPPRSRRRKSYGRYPARISNEAARAALPDGPVYGADVVQLNPDADVSGATAGIAAKFVREFIACISGY
jgi:arginase family enzyme